MLFSMRLWKSFWKLSKSEIALNDLRLVYPIFIIEII